MHFIKAVSDISIIMYERTVALKYFPTGPEFSPKPSTSPPHLGSPGRKPPKSPPERKPVPILDAKRERNPVRDLSSYMESITLLRHSCEADLEFCVLCVLGSSALQRLELLLGSALAPSDHAEAHRRRLLRYRLQGQVARRRRHQDPESDRADAGAAAGLQE